jgi:hypothetical protein
MPSWARVRWQWVLCFFFSKTASLVLSTAVRILFVSVSTPDDKTSRYEGFPAVSGVCLTAMILVDVLGYG